LDLFFKFKDDIWKPENQRLVICNNTTLHKWHVSRKVIRNEKLKDIDKVRLGYFAFHNGVMLLINERLPGMKDLTEDKEIPIGGSVEITDGKKILLSNEEGGRLFITTITNN
jgi:hypothetical protein